MADEKKYLCVLNIKNYSEDESERTCMHRTYNNECELKNDSEFVKQSCEFRVPMIKPTINGSACGNEKEEVETVEVDPDSLPIT